MTQKHFTVRARLNITNTLGSVVLKGIEDSDMGKMIEDQTQGAGKLVAMNHEWDNGVLTNDLYLAFHILIDCKQVIKNETNVVVGEVMDFLTLDGPAVKDGLGKAFRNGFVEKMTWGVVSITGFRVDDGFCEGCRFE